MQDRSEDVGRGALRVGIACSVVAILSVASAVLEIPRGAMTAWVILAAAVLVFGVLVTVRVLATSGRISWRPITAVVLVAGSILLVAGSAMARLL